MRYVAAREAMYERTAAIGQTTPAAMRQQLEREGHTRRMVSMQPEEVVRLLLNGLVAVEDMDLVVDGVRAASLNVLDGLVAAPSIEEATALTFVSLAQQVGLGVHLERPLMVVPREARS